MTPTSIEPRQQRFESLDHAKPSNSLAANRNSPSPEDLELLCSGDPAAFDQMVSEQAPRIRRLVSRLLGWDADVESTVQDVFVDAWLQIQSFRRSSSVSTWLSGIAINKARNVQRRRKIWRRCFATLCLNWTPATEPPEPDQQSHEIQKAIRQLNHKEREVIVLVGLEKKPTADVAKLLGVKKNTVEVRLHRARQQLKKILKNQNDAQK